MCPRSWLLLAAERRFCRCAFIHKAGLKWAVVGDTPSEIGDRLPWRNGCDLKPDGALRQRRSLEKADSLE